MHPRISVNNICFMDEPIERQLGYWPGLGAGRFSLVGPQLDAGAIELVRDALADGGFALETIVQPFSSRAALDSPEAVLDEARAGLNSAIEAAQQLGARSIYMTTGGRGGFTWEQAAAAFSAAIAPCIPRARAAGIALMIENAPPQYADLHIAHSLRDTITLAEMAGIGICIDLFSCWTEADLQTLIGRAVPHCHLVQVSDYLPGDRALPARAVPGDGAMPLRQLLQWLLDAGYEGVFDLELLGPRIDAEGHPAAVRRAVQRLAELLQELGV